MTHQPHARTALLGGALVLLGQGALVASVPCGAGSQDVDGLVVSLERRETGGPAQELVPGSALPLDLTVANPYRVPVRVTALGVRVSRVGHDRRDRCESADFATSDGGVLGVTVPALGSTSLGAAGVPAGEWPSVAMTRGAADQDRCRGVALTLDFSARGRFA